MWLLFSTFYLVIVGISGRSTNGNILIHPRNIDSPGNTADYEEIELSDHIILSDVVNIPDNVELPDVEYFLHDTNIPEDIELEDEETNLPTESVSENPTVVITQGTVVGSYAEDGAYAEFHGIPYADATSGSNRFKAPNPPPTFRDTFIANRKDIKCVRALGTGYEGTEDCLVANIFTPSLDSTRRLSVMVWVKGKEFDKSYDYEPSFKNFIEQDVVIVTLNYRESVLGFLCLGTETAPGNAGLKDIVAGLRWVQGNIAEFGGNPNDITLVGHGSGAAAVDLVTLSPMANGLIHKAIAQSGNALSPWAVSRDNVHYAIQVAEALGHVITDIKELSEVFQRTSVPALMGVINELDLTDNSLAFAPCLERGNLENIEPFMVKSPYQSFQDGHFLQIPFIIGYVDNEGTIRSEEAIEDNWLNKMDESFSDFIQPDLEFESNEEKTHIAQNIRSFYFRNDSINMEQVENYIHYHGDTMILVSTLREARLRVVNRTSPVYLYQFSYKGSLGEPFVGPLKVDSAAHSEELAYLFPDTNNDDIPERDRMIGEILAERWCWFAKTGQPLSSKSSVFWPAYTASQSNYLRVLDNEEINEQSAFDVTLVNPHPEVVSFWDQIYEEHFLDAESKWELTDDDDEDDNGEDNGSGEGGGGEEVTPEEDNNGESDDNSAPSVVGYTFSIIALFTILNKVHLSQMLL